LVVLLAGQADSVLNGLCAAGDISLGLGIVLSVTVMADKKDNSNRGSCSSANTNPNCLAGAVSP
jgi:hypothetical protein